MRSKSPQRYACGNKGGLGREHQRVVMAGRQRVENSRQLSQSVYQPLLFLSPSPLPKWIYPNHSNHLALDVSYSILTSMRGYRTHRVLHRVGCLGLPSRKHLHCPLRCASPIQATLTSTRPAHAIDEGWANCRGTDGRC